MDAVHDPKSQHT